LPQSIGAFNRINLLRRIRHAKTCPIRGRLRLTAVSGSASYLRQRRRWHIQHHIESTTTTNKTRLAARLALFAPERCGSIGSQPRRRRQRASGILRTQRHIDDVQGTFWLASRPSQRSVHLLFAHSLISHRLLSVSWWDRALRGRLR
jgi:hypothetical protein